MKRINHKNGHSAFLGIAVGAALLAGMGAAYADPPTDRTPCFFITQWRGWKSPSPNVLYLGVNMHDVYRVDLSAGSRMLRDPTVHLVSRSTGSASVCSALDLQLDVVDDMGGGGRLGGGMREPLIASKLTKLTPEEVAAIPRQFRPN